MKAIWVIGRVSSGNPEFGPLDIPKDFGLLPRDLEMAIFRIVQECLTNVTVSPVAKIRISRRVAQVIVEVADWGKGIATEKKQAMDVVPSWELG